MSNKYVDVTAIMQIIGCVFNQPQLLDYDDKYKFTDYDFPNDFHKIVFGSIYKLHDLGAEKITIESVVDFLTDKPKKYGVFHSEKGEEWLQKVSELAEPSTFDYYYGRLKKMSLLRAYSDIAGVDVSDIYDPDNILDVTKKQIQEEFLDNASISDIVERIDKKIDSIKSDYTDGAEQNCAQAGEGIHSLLERLKQYPEAGVPLYGKYINTITRGARLKKFYLRSGPTGTGKTRTMIADACYIGCNQLFEPGKGWVMNGRAEPVLYITTEQELEEIQTMMLAFLSNVDEEHILTSKYDSDDEEARVQYAADLLEKSPIYIELLPDFSLQDVEDRIRRNIRDHNTSYVCHDYIHTSLKILEEITQKSGGVRLREDNVLFMLSIRLKDLCNKYGVFILSATQLNGDYVNSPTPDQNLLRGAKAIADKIDIGLVLLPVTEEDREKLKDLVSSGGYEMPQIKLSVYKNRRGKYKGVYLWCKANLGTCRVDPMFCTTYTYDFVPIEDTKIEIDYTSAF